ncbi:S53 family peptidase [Terriglobus aquaticus]|uniref:Protease pro-enzyme activation domain-containing protein n=1 Tax=Terriglobus aquaticus TaxID=940139 RepID=A0ABW9KKN5_9BACT|nr:S53 family peptidase [Terriglobus aquaticus]
MPKLTFAAQARTALSGSQRPPLPGGQQDTKPVRSSAQITVSVIVRRKQPLNANALGEQRLTRAQYKAQHSADPAALKAVLAFAKEFNLSAEADAARRTVQLTGTVADMQRAFDVKLRHHAAANGEIYRVRQGDICLPESLQGIVEAVLGLDNRPQAKPHFRIHKGAAQTPDAIVHPRATNTSFTPVQVAQLYGLPPNSRATGQTIALIELGGGFKTADIKAYFQGLNLPVPTVTAVSVDKGKNKSDGPNGADGEVMLDIEVAAAVAPGAKIVVYFAPNTDQGFIDAITTAVHDTANKPSVISISWGGPEDSWTAQARNALDQACQSAAALGITVLAAAGDSGSSDGESSGNHVDFPASSPHVLACGGTKLTGSGTTIQSEVVWNETAANEGATGGGISTVFAQPSWQAGIAATKSGRGVPDVSGNADPATGYQVRVDGQNLVIGGTSAVAPLWAGLLAVVNAQSKTTVGFVQPRLYAANGSSSFHDITSGNNGAFKAGPGWDACTGLGSPNVPNLITLLAQSASTTKPTKPKPTRKTSAATS